MSASRVSNPRPRALERYPSLNQPSAGQVFNLPLTAYTTYTGTSAIELPIQIALQNRPRRSHRRQSPAWPLDRVGAARRRNGCGSPRGTQTTGSSGLDRSNASIGSCVPSRSFGRWWRRVCDTIRVYVLLATYICENLIM